MASTTPVISSNEYLSNVPNFENRAITIFKEIVQFSFLIFVLLAFISLLPPRIPLANLFQGFSEILGIVVSIGIFTFLWHSRQYLANSYFIFLGIAYLFIGSMDVLHMLLVSHAGLDILENNLSLRVLFGSSYLESISLIIAPLLIGKRIRTDVIVISFALTTALLIILIFNEKLFITNNILFIQSHEFVVFVIYFFSALLLFSKRKYFDVNVFRLLLISIALIAISELLFGLSFNAQRYYNTAGNYARIVALFLIYKAVIETGFTKPYNLLFRELKEEKDFIERLFNTAKTLILVLDLDGRVIRVNPYLEEKTGYTSEEIIGKTWSEITSASDLGVPDKEILEKAMEGFLASNCIVSPILTKQGNTRYLEWFGDSFRNSKGEILGVLAVGQDITTKRQMEQELMRKNQELTNFAYMVSHDLKSPINIIAEYLVILKEDPGALDEVYDVIMSQAKEMSEFINNLLDLSRAGKIIDVVEEIDLAQLIRDVFSTIKPPTINAELIITGNIPEIPGDFHRMRYVFSNLFNNSIQHRDQDKDSVSIEIGSKVSSRGVTLFIRDNGTGIPPEIIDKIFEPGYTTRRKGENKGTGFGLAIVKRIIEAHNGSIQAIPKAPGQGAEFIIELPISQEK